MSDQTPASKDCFAPPDDVCECYCLHCGRTFMSDTIWFQKVVGARDGFGGFWMCPTANCGGAGFTFDIFPTDPEHSANDGWCDCDDEECDEDEDTALVAEEVVEWDPAEPKYAEMDEEFAEDDEDMEGEEWKHGLQPGESLPEPEWVAEARKEWERTREKYDQPDERPRILDWSDRERQSGKSSPLGEDDIPF